MVSKVEITEVSVWVWTEDNKSAKEVMTAKPAMLHHVSLKKTAAVLHAKKFDDETMEDEHNLPTVDIKKSSHVAHMSVSQLKLQEQVSRQFFLVVPIIRFVYCCSLLPPLLSSGLFDLNHLI